MFSLRRTPTLQLQWLVCVLRDLFWLRWVLQWLLDFGKPLHRSMNSRWFIPKLTSHLTSLPTTRSLPLALHHPMWPIIHPNGVTPTLAVRPFQPRSGHSPSPSVSAPSPESPVGNPIGFTCVAYTHHYIRAGGRGGGSHTSCGSHTS